MTGETKKNNLVSVIIPTYNRAYSLERTIKSVIDQSYQNWEIIVVDNNSTDNTDELIASLNDTRIQLLKINNGGIIAASRNIGIKASKGTYIAFLDSDDWWEPEKLTNAIDTLLGGYDFTYHDLYLFDGKKKGKVLKSDQLFKPIYKDLLINGKRLNLSSVVVSKTLIQMAGCFDENIDLVGAEDADLYLKIAKHTEKFKKLRGVLGHYSVHDDNMTTCARNIKHITYRMRVYKEEYEEMSSGHPVWALYTLARAYDKLDYERAFVVKNYYRVFLKAGWSSRKLKSLLFIIRAMVK